MSVVVAVKSHRKTFARSTGPTRIGQQRPFTSQGSSTNPSGISKSSGLSKEPSVDCYIVFAIKLKPLKKINVKNKFKSLVLSVIGAKMYQLIYVKKETCRP